MTQPVENPGPTTQTAENAAGQPLSHTLSAPPADQAGLLQQYREHLLGVFGTPQAVLVRGDGARVWDADGHELLDLLGGIAVNALGHAHPAWVQGVTEQARRLGHVSNLFTSPQQIEAADKLLAVLGMPEGSRVFFTNSGTEANEAAFKLARRNGGRHPGRDGARTKVVAVDGAFHGRTMGALALTAKKAYREPFEPLPGGVVHIAPMLEALEEVMDDSVSAVFVEPVRGEQGVHALPGGWLQRARELTRQHGALLILDEVQCGMGRTGTWLEGLRQLSPGEFPDAVTLAKGLGGGFPVGAMVTVGPQVSDLLTAGQHGTTFGGNPLATAAVVATVNTIETENLLENVRSVGEILATGLSRTAGVTEVRAHGLLIGFDLSDARSEAERTAAPLGAAVVAAARAQGLLINATGDSTIRLAPPLILTPEQARGFLAAMPGIIERARRAAAQA